MERQFSSLLKTENKIINLILLSRPWNGSLIGLISIIGYLLGERNNIIEIIFLASTFFISYLGGAILNDIFDYKIDKINMPYRPLQEKKINLNTTKKISTILFIVAGVLSLYNLILFIGFSFFIIIAVAYSTEPFKLSRRGIFGPIFLTIVTAIIPGVTGLFLAEQNIQEVQIFGILSLSLLTLGVILLKDFKDIRGDIKENKKTIVIIFGTKNTLLISKVIVFLSLLSTTAIFYIIKPNYLLIIGFIVIEILFIKNFFIKKAEQLSKVIKAEEIYSKQRIALFLYLFIITINLL